MEKDEKKGKGWDEYKGTWAYRLRIIAKTIPNETAFIYGKTKLTWRELDRKTNAFANALLDLGMRKGDNFLSMDYNTLQNFIAFFTCFKNIFPYCNVNYRFVPEEIAHVCNNSQGKALLLNEVSIDNVRKTMPRLETVKNFIVTGENVPDDMISFDDLIAKYPETDPISDPRFVKPVGRDPFSLLYTGGTTGMPKGVEWDIYPYFKDHMPMGISLISGGFARIADAPKEAPDAIGKFVPIPGVSSILESKIVKDILRSPDFPGIATKVSRLLFSPAASPLTSAIAPFIGKNLKWLIACPLMHAWGWEFTNVAMLLGSTNIFATSKSLNPQEICEIIDRDKANIMAITGDGMARPIAEFMNKNEGKYDLSSLFLIFSSGMHLSGDVKKILHRQMPQLIITEILASSEGSGIAMTGTVSSDKEVDTGIFTVPAGKKVKIIDPNTGEECKKGGAGEIATWVENLTAGYYRDDERTAKTWRILDGERYVFTGDYGFLDEEGKIHLVGRGSECINTGGEKVWPDEIEKVIMKNHKVQDVAITGVPDKRWGEAVTAVVELNKGEKATEEEIIEFCKGKIAGYKIPKHVIFVDEIPKTEGVMKHAYKYIKKLARERVLGS